ncbi:hypothetical protein PVK06_020125 [Gossypium arboreum]|uniref:CCHC-type domain-containing protein n=1 Tax=Gossypium arboreum TaxID=29729 RepID=A0ABR0PM37_GOSAR|nr:hypothetical protein PVK06_020125 [Gossypium arboreum]
MSNLAKLEFAALDISDAKIHLNAKDLGNTILVDKESTNQDKTKAIIFIRHHLHERLKVEYLTVKDPLELWKNLKERFDHQKTVILPKARYDWMHLWLYSELISCLLEVEQNNELLMKNHGIHPTGSTPFPEVNVAVHNNYENRKYRGHGCGRGRSGGRDQGCISNCYHGGHNNDNSNHQKKNNNERQEISGQNNPSKTAENICYRCGMKGHWPRTCRMFEHLVKFYQASIKKKGKDMETNFISQNDQIEIKDEDIHYNTKTDHAYEGDKFNDLNNITCLHVVDFFENH